MPGAPILSMSEKGNQKIWSYQSTNRTPGAFRAVAVEGLLGNDPTIQLHEFNDLNWADEQTGDSGTWPKYTAISHVWKASAAVEDICKKRNRPLRIAISTDNGRAEHELGWYGLVHAGYAAKSLHSDYLWLDLLCIDQVKRMNVDGYDNDKEKSKLIKY